MTYQILFHPEVEGDLEVIARVISEYSGFEVAKQKLFEIQKTVEALRETPHKGSIREDLPGAIRAIPAGRRGVIVFEVDDEHSIVYIFAITYGGADWISKVDLRYGL